MKISDLPQIKINSIEDGILICSVTITNLLGENWIGIIFNEKNQFAWGRFKEYNKEDKKTKFKLDDQNDREYFQKFSVCYYADAYWGDRILLVINSNLIWSKIKFKPTDAKKIDNGIAKIFKGQIVPAETLIPKGWNHEHCEICWEKINEESPEAYYEDTNEIWICQSCFDNYLTKKDISFMNWHE